MIGLSIIYNSAGEEIDDSLIGRFSKGADMPNCNREESRLSPSLWVQNVYHPVTAAPGEMIYCDNGNVQLIFHGEVYNCPELAEHLGVEKPTIKSIADGPELVTLGLEREGMHFVEKTNGSFVLLAWYPRENKLYLANDRFGLRPHYYGWCGETLLVSPTVEAIHRCWNRQTRIDRVGALEFFTFQHLMGNKTMVEDISLLPPASICQVERGTLVAKQYWDFPYPEKPLAASEGELCEELQRRLSIAVNRQLPANCSLGVPLSGGLDSRVLAGIASQSIPHLPVFTFGNQNCMDRRFASQIAHHIGAEHHCASPDNADWEGNFRASARLCDGMSPVLDAHIMLLRSSITDKVGVVLDGLFGETVLGGHLTRSMVYFSPPPDLSNWLLNHKFKIGFSSSEIEDLFIDRSFTDRLSSLDNVLRELVPCLRNPLPDSAV